MSFDEQQAHVAYQQLQANRGSNPVESLSEIAWQCAADSRRWFPDTFVGKDLTSIITLLTLCNSGEAGELANKVKKVVRGDKSLEEARPDIAMEAMDNFIYLMNIFAELGVDIVKLYNHKRAINEARFGGKA